MSKRLLDIAFALMGVTLLAPLMLVIALLVLANVGGPVLFRQARPGLHGRLFTLYKFRSMAEKRDGNNELMPDAQRLSGFGRFLRATSLDELPELWNVLRGDMSLVGPRPLLPDYLPLYTPEQARRHEVLPGLTGWAQVMGRNALDWETRLAMDVWYVDHRSLWLDLRILWMTLGAVCSGRGIHRDGHATMPKFTGTRNTES
jgi:lipopolysaccharide/colanic/teichoic acid biosynthesis glycosyltransferase